MTKRDKLNERLRGYSMLPPKENIAKMTDDELERYLDLLDSAFESAFREAAE